MTPLVLTLALLQQSGTALQLHEVPKDGNCLFSAVALSAALVDNLPGQTRARAVRTAAARLRVSAMNLLCPHGTPDPELSLGGLPVEVLIEPQGGESQAGYCRRLRMAGEWGRERGTKCPKAPPGCCCNQAANALDIAVVTHSANCPLPLSKA